MRVTICGSALQFPWNRLVLEQRAKRAGSEGSGSPPRSLHAVEEGVSRSSTFERAPSPDEPAAPWRRSKLAAVIEAATDAATGDRIAAAKEAVPATGTPLRPCGTGDATELERSERGDSVRSEPPFPPVFHGPLVSSRPGSAALSSAPENMLPDAIGAPDALEGEVRGLIERLHAVERALQQQRLAQQQRDRGQK